MSLCAEAVRLLLLSKAACLLLLAEPVHLYNKRHGQKVTLQEQK